MGNDELPRWKIDKANANDYAWYVRQKFKSLLVALIRLSHSTANTRYITLTKPAFGVKGRNNGFKYPQNHVESSHDNEGW
jgi:hypothetical protein